MTVAFRPAVPRDRDFIVGSWESSYQDAHTSGMVPMIMWAGVMRPIVEHYLDRPYTRCIVAYNPDDTDPLADLHGFICGEPDEKPPIVLFVYVKEAFRRAGIATKLFAALGIDPNRPFEYLCSTPVMPHLVRKVPFAKWKPNRARYSREARRQSR